VWDIVVKKKRKQRSKDKPLKSTKTRDLGGQTLVQENGKLYRLPDMAEVVLGNKHLQRKHNSVHENYFNRNQLCPSDAKLNATRFMVGQKIEFLAYVTGKTKSCTQSLDTLMGIPHGTEQFHHIKIDSETDLMKALQFTKDNANLLWQVLVDNIPATYRKMIHYRKGLDQLIEFWKV
jgi:hypothetical protein